MMYRFSCDHLGNSSTNIPLSTIFETILHAKTKPQCVDCGCPGPNLWACLYKNCNHIGCSDKSNDHSTLHNAANPSHCIHINLQTRRMWCYACRNEVFILKEKENDGDTLDELQSSTSNNNNNSNNIDKRYEKIIGMSGDESSDDDNDVAIKPVGLVGLQNIGNTCYMNAALQALSNAVPLARFFIDCGPTVQVLSEGKKPGLSRTFQSLLRDMWLRRNGGYVSPSGILGAIRNVYPMFRGYYQHDTQEFLRNFMDQLHEELKQTAPPEPIQDFDLSTECSSDEPPLNINYDSSEGEYETCDSGVSERSSLSDDTERSSNANKRRLSRSSSPSRRMRTRYHSMTVVENQPINLPPTPVVPPLPTTLPSSGTSTPLIQTFRPQIKYRSIISDIFDGKLLSSVQCLTCDRVSSRVETFQDLSLPIPSKDHLLLLHGRPTTTTTSTTSATSINNPSSSSATPSSTLTATGTPSSSSSSSSSSKALVPVTESWLTWIFAWFKSWFYGPTVTLHDCLSAFFSTDELKGDNMYSCEKCNKLRNGIKFSKVLQLPEVLCIHLKRFRHELMFSSKISSTVSFPLKGLDMRPYLHSDCVSQVTSYDLFSIICHYGTAGGGHYVCLALNNGQWYEFDDQYVTKVSPEKVQSCEAYVLFYRKVTHIADSIREKAAKIWRQHNDTLNLTFISRQWLNRFNTCAEPGPIDNSDILCTHGLINPERELLFEDLTVCLPTAVYEYLYKKYGGCPPLNTIELCQACTALNERLQMEKDLFTKTLHLDSPRTHLISVNWYNQWQRFIQKRTTEPPGPIDNSKVNLNNIDPNECFEISEDIWKFFHDIYGGGPELKIKGRLVNNHQRKESESSQQSNDNDETLVATSSSSTITTSAPSTSFSSKTVANAPPQSLSSSTSSTTTANTTTTTAKFVIPNLKKEKVDNVNKAVYCASGEPMETETNDKIEPSTSNSCNNSVIIPTTTTTTTTTASSPTSSSSSSSTTVLDESSNKHETNCTTTSVPSEDEDGKRPKINNVRQRKRRLVLSSSGKNSCVY